MGNSDGGTIMTTCPICGTYHVRGNCPICGTYSLRVTCSYCNYTYVNEQHCPNCGMPAGDNDPDD